MNFRYYYVHVSYQNLPLLIQELEVAVSQQTLTAGTAASVQLALIAQLQRQLAQCQADLARARDQVAAQPLALDPGNDAEDDSCGDVPAGRAEVMVLGGKRAADDAAGATPG